MVTRYLKYFYDHHHELADSYVIPVSQLVTDMLIIASCYLCYLDWLCELGFVGGAIYTASNANLSLTHSRFMWQFVLFSLFVLLLCLALLRGRNWLLFVSTRVHLQFLVGSVLLIFLAFCVVSCVLKWCQCLWIFHSLLALRFSLMFVLLFCFVSELTFHCSIVFLTRALYACCNIAFSDFSLYPQFCVNNV